MEFFALISYALTSWITALALSPCCEQARRHFFRSREPNASVGAGTDVSAVLVRRTRRQDSSLQDACPGGWDDLSQTTVRLSEATGRVDAFHRSAFRS